MLTAAQYAVEAPDTTREIYNVTFTSYVGLADLALHFSDRDGDWVRRAIEAFEKMPKAWPGHMKIADGQRAVLAWARLIQADGRAGEALELVNEVIASAKRYGTNVDREAGDVLANLMGHQGAGGTAVDPALLARVAKSKFRQADYGGCIQANQAVIRACATKEQMDEHAWSAWQQIANCYGQEKRYYASYLALDAIWQAWKKDQGNETLTPMTDEVGYLRGQLLQYVARETKDAKDKDAANKAQEEFKKLKPNAPRNLGAAEGKAFALVNEARSLLRKDPEAGKAKAREAANALKKVDKTSLLMPRVEAALAECELLLGDPDKAIAMANAWLAKKRANVIDPTAKRALIEGKSLCITLIVRAHLRKAEAAPEGAARKEAYQALLDTLDKYERDFLQAAQGAESLITQWRAEALINVGKIGVAETLVWKFVKAQPDHPNARFLAGTMAREVEKEADVWQSKGDEDRFAQTMLRAAKLREFVLDHLKEREPRVVVFVGESFAKGRDFETAAKYYKEALDLYRTLFEAEADEKKTDAYAQSLSSVRIQQIELLLDQKKFDEAIPLLEERLVEDPKDRAEVISSLQSGTGNITTASIRDLLQKMSRNKGLLSTLSRAWLEAKSKERLIGAINLCDILLYATPKDERHDTVEYVKVRVRRLQAYLQYGIDFNQPNAFDHVISGIQNGIVTPGYEERYEQLVPGTKKRLQELLRSAQAKRGTRK
jgi:tetratricopeptide (TPR) repeat protein